MGNITAQPNYSDINSTSFKMLVSGSFTSHQREGADGMFIEKVY